MSELMVRLTNLWARVVEPEEGQGLVEYALILVLVSIVAIAMLAAVGTNVTAVLSKVQNALKFT
jgi:pilus assembly protein Flp/PilA